MRSRFENELENLNLDLIRMGSVAESAIENAMEVLSTYNVELTKRVFEDNYKVDAMARQIESKSMKLIMKQQPVAKDLRAISTALKMITDIERICDQAADIAEITMHLCEEPNCDKPLTMNKMGRLAIDMVRMAVDSYVKSDTELAEKVIKLDDEQDELFNTAKHELVSSVIKDEKQIDNTVDCLMIIKYLERISDHAENIAEWTIFAVTGVHKNEQIL